VKGFVSRSRLSFKEIFPTCARIVIHVGVVFLGRAYFGKRRFLRIAWRAKLLGVVGVTRLFLERTGTGVARVGLLWKRIRVVGINPFLKRTGVRFFPTISPG